MPGKFLHVGCAMTCPECMAEIKVPNPKNQIYCEEGKLVLVATDEFWAEAGIGNCLGPKQQPSPVPPCGICNGPLALTWTMTSAITKIDNVPALLQASVGEFLNFMKTPTTVLIRDSTPATIGHEA